MPKASSAKYYQNNKKRLQKKTCERYQSFSKVGNKKKQNMFVNDRKIYQKMKNESLLGIEKVL